ncbi:Tumor necrosis factor ligand superfamily member 15 [Channa argus]|uniref:Tumor necrosis factor ligand superfamily member 15 n=1 Tax=Channa argus TaxID=215402 RepID=A0A6G1Q1K4_CHAAH|nr:Tumor necrosis factor ligand superfamily member 15 [Channa argus]
MEMFDRRLLSQWETSGMGEEGCCCCCCEGEAGLHRQHTLIQLLRKKESSLRRTGICFAVAAFLLILLAMASMVAVVLGVRGFQCQPIKQPANCTSVPNNRSTGRYLQWESNLGNAYCNGGFSYSNGALVVPKTGIYRVFLQMTYEINTCKDDVTLSLTVYTYSDGYKEDVRFLESTDTVSCRKKSWTKSLYTSGLIHLEANSKLRVQSLHPELIVSHEEQVFFGAQLLPP